MLDRLRCFAPAEVIYFDSSAKGARSARRLSRGWCAEKCAPFTLVLVCTSVQTATSRYLSLSRASKFLGRASFAPSPLAARASAIRSRTCGRQRLAFLAASATGGARKPNPSEGGEGAPAPCTELQKCKPRLSPPTAGCPHPSRRGTVPHRATFPKGKAKRSRAVRRFSCSGKA